MNLQGKTAIVTGAGSGIGKATAIRLAAVGATVVAWDRRADLADVAAAMNEAAAGPGSGRIVPEIVDITHTSELEPRMRDISAARGSLDILVHCAGIIQTIPFLDIDEASWDRMLDTNLKSAFFLMKAAAKPMIRQRSGRIVSVSSIAGRSGRALNAHYAVCKAGIISLTRSAALAFGEYGIRVNAVCPGVIRTPMTEHIQQERAKLLGQGAEDEGGYRRFLPNIPLKQIGEPEEVAETIAFLCAPESAYVHGQSLNVCGGFEMD